MFQFSESTQRQRCDSMPSSNNPSSNKARTLNRPISVYSRSPTTSSPLSPNSQTISNKSDDDFSINIDEVDNADDLLKNVKSISSSHLKMTILEEKYEDISLSETKQSKTQENVLEDIAQKEGYLIMLPSNDSVKRTETRSRTSSFAEEITNSFGYNPRYHLPDCLSSSASSVTSGTPSTDTRFSAFHLEKTFSHFSDDNDSLNKPIRTYSVGSKPENAKTKAFDSFYYEETY
uniref:CSON014895 protein n=1 Tax=Culicoides sonorensis TaxID=179676 RepID=A0A336K2G8_CULSO